MYKKFLATIPEMCKESVRIRINGAGKRVYIKKPFHDLITPHKIRGSFISNMLNKGVPEHIVKRYSGHTANSKAFARYVKADKNIADKAYHSSMDFGAENS